MTLIGALETAHDLAIVCLDGKVRVGAEALGALPLQAEALLAQNPPHRMHRPLHRSGHRRAIPIMDYLGHHNADPKPYQWTDKPDAILTKVAKAKDTLRTLH